MKLVVGLGNPGRKYVGTRHNIGVEAVSLFAEKFAGPTTGGRKKFHGEVVEAVIDQQRLLLLFPQTYMNASGKSVKAACDFYKLPLEEIIIVCDDFQLPLGKLRLRKKGSAGGQKGLQNTIDQLGSQEFSRLRIGIGEPPPNWDVADYVLGRFTQQESEEMKPATARAAEAIAVWARQGVDASMNQFNC